MLSLYMLLLFCLWAPPTSSACGDHWQGVLPPCWRRCPRTEVGWDEAGMHAWHAWHIATNPLPPPVCLEEAQADPRALVASDKWIRGNLNVCGVECASWRASDLCWGAALGMLLHGWVALSVCAEPKVAEWCVLSAPYNTEAALLPVVRH